MCICELLQLQNACWIPWANVYLSILEALKNMFDLLDHDKMSFSIRAGLGLQGMGELPRNCQKHIKGSLKTGWTHFHRRLFAQNKTDMQLRR